ncbi:NAD(P)/FAD-dependent oxidoreductase [Ramlibacter sp. GTP1]|uniref:Ferredoxin--NADP reductase n=1 Tax=Ramlibacter albus TaxID=2079448 RepID=A0A923MBS6_9BURK|nr:NAD(P)/FAD-dependent oxidoreductase [Ramlibacter albus]MBC5767760.1 NAD(P)/FAD-dependent oxidoreductase [Ramlibacter albus]
MEQGLTETDALVVGAGPVGLFQVFQLGLQEIRAHVVDSLPYAGGQCVELYGDKPIYDIPGISVATGRELTERLLQQVEPFSPTLHFNQVVSEVERQADGRFRVATSQGTQFLTKTLFIAAGVGAFQPRMLKVDGIEKFASQVAYRVEDPAQFAGRDVLVLGDEDPALQAACDLAATARVTLLHRRDGFRADPSRVAAMRELVAQGRMQFKVGQVTGLREAGGRLAAVEVAAPDATVSALPTDVVLVMLGISPKLGPIADWGLDLERKQLKVDTEQFSTSVPGIFAVGDINTYPGKKKLILCGFHEATLAAFGAAAIVFPGKEIHLQYTTTSTKLHRLLGVSG